MNRIMVQWLYGQLPELIRVGVLSDDTAERIRAYYGKADMSGRTGKPGAWILAIFGVLGAALIALGIILLFAHNWDALSRPVRAVISFLPLVTGQALAGYTLARRRGSVALREGSGTFLTLSIGACIALIAQTYHIPGNLTHFLFTWLLLALPVVYLLDVTVPAMLYMAGIVAWTISARVDRDGNVQYFWLLAVLIAPYLWRTFRFRPQSPAAVWLAWGVSLCASMTLAPLMNSELPGIGLLLYSAMLGAFFLMGTVPGQSDARWKMPFTVVGLAGTVIVTLVMTYVELWEDVAAWRIYFANPGEYWPDIAMAVGLYVWVVALLRIHVRLTVSISLAFGICAPLSLVGYLTAWVFQEAYIPVAIFNVYMLALGVWLAVRGARMDRLAVLNGGLGVFTIWITARFFDADMSFLWRGILFIILGVAFLVANMVILNRRRRIS